MTKAYSVRIPDELVRKAMERGPLSQVINSALEAFLAPQLAWTEPAQVAKIKAIHPAVSYARPPHQNTCKCAVCITPKP